MDLLERYVAAVARELPEAQRADIAAELRDVLLNRVEEREAELGRPLAPAELEALLKDYGHPLSVAARYRKTQHLIGPEMFPFWRKGLQHVLGWTAGVIVVLAALAVAGGLDAQEVADKAASQLFVSLMIGFAAVTLVSAAIERFAKGCLFPDWKPRQLPPAEGRARSAFDLVVEIAMGVVFLLWWTGVIRFPNVIPRLELRIDLAPIFATLFWPILLHPVLQIVANLAALVRPGRVRLNRSLTAIAHAYGAAVVVAILQGGHWLVVSSPRIPAAALSEIQANFDVGMRVGLVASLIMMVGLAIFEVLRLRRDVRTATPLVNGA